MYETILRLWKLSHLKLFWFLEMWTRTVKMSKGNSLRYISHRQIFNLFFIINTVQNIIYISNFSGKVCGLRIFFFLKLHPNYIYHNVHYYHVFLLKKFKWFCWSHFITIEGQFFFYISNCHFVKMFTILCKYLHFICVRLMVIHAKNVWNYLIIRFYY